MNAINVNFGCLFKQRGYTIKSLFKQDLLCGSKLNTLVKIPIYFKYFTRYIGDLFSAEFKGLFFYCFVDPYFKEGTVD